MDNNREYCRFTELLDQKGWKQESKKSGGKQYQLVFGGTYGRKEMMGF